MTKYFYLMPMMPFSLFFYSSPYTKIICPTPFHVLPHSLNNPKAFSVYSHAFPDMLTPSFPPLFFEALSGSCKCSHPCIFSYVFSFIQSLRDAPTHSQIFSHFLTYSHTSSHVATGLSSLFPPFLPSCRQTSQWA